MEQEKQEFVEEQAVDIAQQEREMRSGISKVGGMMVAATAIFVGISVIAAIVGESLSRNQVNSEVVQILRYLPNYVISMPLIILLLKKLPGTELEKREFSAKNFLVSVAITFGIMVVCNILGLILAGIIGSLLGVQVSNTTMEIIETATPGISVIFISICAPVFEELVFRKMLVTRVVKYGEGVAVLLSGLMFGLFHGNLNQFAYTFGMGAFFAYLYVKTGKIKITIALHVIVNFTTSVILSGLMSWSDFGTLSSLSVAARESGDMTAVMAFLETHLVPVLLMFGFLFLEYGLAIAGIILLLIFRKKMKLNQGEYAFSKGKKAALMFGNVGMIVYCVFWITNIVLQILGVG